MIFVTVGAQMPFDRLVRAVDAWAFERGRCDEVFVQIGEGGWEPEHVAWKRFLEPDEFRCHVDDADVLVAHAGTGSIFGALEVGKPILVMPRHARLGETRNDHQIATARSFGELGHVRVAWDEGELAGELDEIVRLGEGAKLPSRASDELIRALADFVGAG